MKQRMLSLLLVLVMIRLPGFALAEGHSVTKFDDDGYLYFMDYNEGYYGPHVIESMREAGIIDPGCSNFITHNPEGGTALLQELRLSPPHIRRGSNTDGTEHRAALQAI